jgi:hypothetical protein
MQSTYLMPVIGAAILAAVLLLSPRKPPRRSPRIKAVALWAVAATLLAIMIWLSWSER